MTTEDAVGYANGDLRLDRLVGDALTARGKSGWRVELDAPWCRAEPPDHNRRVQGWKLHVSATPLSAPLMLARCIDVLVEAGTSFKFAATLDYVHALTDPRCDRATGGKILTVYPRDDEQAVALADALHTVTYGLPGQEILSDARFRPDSLVHYRYGAFAGIVGSNLDGRHASRLQAPDGSVVDDTRNAWFSPPAWAISPFAPDPATASSPEQAGGSATAGERKRPSAVLIGGRFEVRGAIALINRGGVYRAVDRTTGADVIIKQARAHTGAQITGWDSRDALRHEAHILSELDGLAPTVISVFDQESDLFLVESLVPGQTLRAWIADQIEGSDADPVAVPLAAGSALAKQLIGLLADVHARGLVCRDFTPNNIMVTPDDGLRLIDPELCRRPGTPSVRGYTPGFGAPEQVRAGRIEPCPGPEVDLYALGTSLFLMATGMEPILTADEPDPRDPADRYAERLAAIGMHNPLAARLAPVIIGLTAADPGSRWTLVRVTTALDEPSMPLRRRPDVPIQRLIDDGLDHLVATMTPQARRLWPGASFGRLIDECSVQYGAAGVLSTFVRAVGCGREDLIPTIRTASDWIARRLEGRAAHLPGLYFGSAGPIWATHDAGKSVV